MREDFGYFMRVHAVDLSRYLPAFLHNGTFGALGICMSFPPIKNALSGKKNKLFGAGEESTLDAPPAFVVRYHHKTNNGCEAHLQFRFVF